MEDADLFMECEEEELEPWQQCIQSDAEDEPEDMAEDEPEDMAEDEPEDEPDTVESKSTAGQVIEVGNPALPKPVVISPMPPASNTLSKVPLITSTLSTPAPAGITKAAPGQQLIITQGAGGLTQMALSQVILPGANAAGGQPIYVTTQGIPVQNLQTGQSPMSIVLNVQQGQAVRPITIVQAPGTPGIFKPTQIITQQAPIRPPTQVVTRAQTPGPFSAMQIPATITIRTTAPVSQPRVKFVSQVAQPSASTRAIPINPQTNTDGQWSVTVKAGDRNLDVQNLMSLMNTASLPSMGQPQTLIVMSNQKTNGAATAPVKTSVPVTQTSPVQVNPEAPLSHTCPRCKAEFKMVEALQGHMCFCCPDVTQSVSTAVPAAKPLNIQKKSPPMQTKSKSMDDSPAEPQSRIVMLVDDFYYGTYEGNRVYVASDNEKGPRSFKCLTCGKKLKSNIRLMNHMKFHVDIEQQNDDSDKHTSCSHCYRQFPTLSRLQSHVESVHNTHVSSSKCKICEWAFDSEPVFLQHMKNTHKPGEMPYVCQVCEYRSSLHSDVHDHFRTWHEDTRFLLCIYCLKVFKHSSTYQHHFARHQNSSVYHCNKCRLQFLLTKEKIEHKVNHHKTFRKPRQLEGLQAGTKVTIRAYASKKTAGPLSSKIGTDISTAQFGQASGHKLNTRLLSPQNTAAGRKQVSKMYDYLVKFQEQRVLFGRQKCVECTFDIPDFANHYPTYVHCSLCLYSTCCSRAYANHMINNHVPGRIQKSRSRKETVSWLKLTCACCDYTTTQGDQMANHLVQFPDHHHCTFFMKEVLTQLESDNGVAEILVELESDAEEAGDFDGSSDAEIEVILQEEDLDVDELDSGSSFPKRRRSSAAPLEQSCPLPRTSTLRSPRVKKKARSCPLTRTSTLRSPRVKKNAQSRLLHRTSTLRSPREKKKAQSRLLHRTSTLRSPREKKKAQRRSSSSGARLLSPRRLFVGPPQVLEQDEEDGWHDVTDEDEEPSLHRFIPKRPPGPQLLPGATYSPLQLFQLFFSSSVVQTIVDNTNKFGEASAAGGKKLKWTPVSVEEFYSFISLIVYMGLVKTKSIVDLWSLKELYQFPFPSSVMSHRRFAAISSNLHLSDPQEDAENMKKKGTPAYDRLFKIKPLYNNILSACHSFFQPRREVSIDERMVASKARSGLKQYMKAKPTKWGYKLFILADSASGYTWNFFVYEGKSASASGKGLGYDSVKTLLDYSLLGHGYMVYMDNFYTTPALLSDLLEENTLACGTIRTHQQGFPKTKRNDLPKRAKRGTIRWYRHGKLLYVRWMDTREVSMCSTMHKAYNGDSVNRRVKDKQGEWSTISVPIPAAVKDYNKYMGGVDLSDALIGYYNVLHKSRKWYKTFFFHFIDIAIVNSFILHQELAGMKGQASLTQKAFREALVIELTKVVKRSEEVAGPSGQSTEEEEPTATASSSKQPAQVEKCMPAFFATDATAGRRKCENCKKEGRQTKTPISCTKCGVPLCLVPARNCFKLWHEEEKKKAKAVM